MVLGSAHVLRRAVQGLEVAAGARVADDDRRDDDQHDHEDHEHHDISLGLDPQNISEVREVPSPNVHWKPHGRQDQPRLTEL